MENNFKNRNRQLDIAMEALNQLRLMVPSGDYDLIKYEYIAATDAAIAFAKAVAEMDHSQK